MSGRAFTLLVLLLCAAATPARAAEFFPSFDGSLAWDANVLRTTAGDRQGDVSAVFGPELRFAEPNGDLTYEASYRFQYEAYTKFSQLNDSDHFIRGRMGWAITPRASTGLSINISRTATTSQRFQAENDPVTGAPADLDFGRDQSWRGILLGDFRYSLSPRWSVSANVNAQYLDWDNPQRFDSTSFRGSIQVQRSLTSRMSAGFGGSATRQTFHSPNLGDGRNSNFYSGFFTWNYQVTQGLSVGLQAGPSYTDPETQDLNQTTQQFLTTVIPNAGEYQDIDECFNTPLGDPVQGPQDFSCNPVGATFTPGGVQVAINGDPGIPDVFVSSVGDRTDIKGTVNLFGSLIVSQRWSRWGLSGSYRRTSTNTGGLGTSQDLDTLNLRLEWKPDSRWVLALDGSVDNRQIASDVSVDGLQLARTTLCVDVDGTLLPGGCPGMLGPDEFQTTEGAEIVGIRQIEVLNGSDVNSRTWSVQFRLSRRVTDNLSIRGFASARGQLANLGSSQSKIPLFRAQFGFRWTFRSVHL